MEKNNSLVPQRQFKGLIPVVKSFLLGDEGGVLFPSQVENSLTTQTWWQWMKSEHSFNRKGLTHLVETGYALNPTGFGIINKILLAQSNIIFTPYWNGKPYKSKSFDLDIEFAMLNFLATGTVIIHKADIIGFGRELKVLNTLLVTEVWNRNKFRYFLDNQNGTRTELKEEDLIFVKFSDLSGTCKTNFGLPPFQAAIMAVESLRYMYEADTATLKNKGVDGILTNDSDEPMIGTDSDMLQTKLNAQLLGVKKSGGIAASTMKLRFLQMGRTAKELQLWDGYKIKNRDMCTVFQINAGQLNDPESNKYANAQEYNKALYNDCVIPFTKKITENKEIKAFLGYEIYLDLSNIDSLQESQSLRFEKNKILTDAIINLNQQVKNGVINESIAVNILVSEWGFDLQEAQINIMKPIIVDTTTEIQQ